MKTVILPNSLRDEINAAIDAALKGRVCSDDERRSIFAQLLSYVDAYGVLPEFSLDKNPLEII